MSQTPLWLEIKTEYIDENLEKVIQYLARESSSFHRDSFYAETEKLLAARVAELLERSRGESAMQVDAPVDPEAERRRIRIFGAYLLVFGKRPGSLAAEAFFHLVEALIRLNPDSNVEELAATAIRAIGESGFENFGFGWPDIRLLQPEVLAHKLPEAVRFVPSDGRQAWYENHGSMMADSHGVCLYAQNMLEALAVKRQGSLGLFDGMLQVMTASSDRLRQADEDNIEAMEQFTKAFIREQARTMPAPVVALKTYQPDDVAPVKYIGKDRLGNLLVETVEDEYEKVRGQINFSTPVFRNIYRTSGIAEYLNPGDVFDAKFIGGERNYFTLEGPFVDVLVNETVEPGKIVNAVLRNINDKGLMTWWTAEGYPAYVEESAADQAYSVGDTALLRIQSASPVGYVYAETVEPSGEHVDESESRRYCVTGMIYSKDIRFDTRREVKRISPELVSGLARMIFACHRAVSRVSEQYRFLCVARILCAMTGAEADNEYVKTICRYLRNLVAFANDRLDQMAELDLSGIEPGCPQMERRASVIRILRAYGRPEDNELLGEVIRNPQSDEVEKRLAKLIQSSNRIDELYPGIKNVIKREITRFLALETEDNLDLEEASGPDLGIESSRLEFKTSFFFAPGNAREQNQEKNIFRSLCSFLNTEEGGTLYLGVNDSGRINGLDNDLQHIQKNVAGAYGGSLDGYIRYITDRARDYFDTDVRVNFKIEPAFDNRVVAIRVEPYSHGVVTFEGVPYVRNNTESVRMSQKLRRQIEARRATSERKEASNVMALKVAMDSQMQAALHGYTSNDGHCDSEQRIVEPFAFADGHNLVWAYDVALRANRLFRVSRMKNVHITSDPWIHTVAHRAGHTDLFRFTGEKPVKVSLRLDPLAKNLLLEEYPDAKDLIADLGDGSWMLTTDIYDLRGVARFYTGLSDHIEIIDSPELADYVRAYFKQALDRL